MPFTKQRPLMIETELTLVHNAANFSVRGNRMKFRSSLVTGCCTLLLQLTTHPVVFAADQPTYWVSAWGTALQPIPRQASLPPLYQAPDVSGRTVRQIIYPTLSGKSVRIHLSNAYAETPLVIDELRIGPSGGGAKGRAEQSSRVTFNGAATVVVPPGGERESDPVTLDLVADAPYAVSSYMGQEQRLSAWHRVANQVNYISSPGNYTANADGKPYATRFTQYVWVTGLSVATPRPSSAVAAIGDSITDGMRSSLNQNQRWPDALARRLERENSEPIGVVNLGISGNRLLSDSPCYGEALESRFTRDVLTRPALKTAILLIGINDINFADMPARKGLDCDFPHTRVSAASLIAGYKRVIARSRQHGVRIIGATLLPASLPPSRESIRLAVNQWIRSSGEFASVIDFDAALRDAAQPAKLRRIYDSGDHIHPSDAGYAEMARAIKLEELSKVSKERVAQ
nr:SGNH/GDSL hydrolase family protein [Paraburkholderia bonniea]